MRKINLTVQSPCHENWDQMQPAEQGKFCASCCKTVTDFTGMSDRQLADFFKKPKENICGRFYADQLERDILIPKKRIPWLRYFFQFTLPAFVLFLKSCGQRSELVGDVVMIKEQPAEKPLILLDGIVLNEVEALPQPKFKLPEEMTGEFQPEITVGIIMPNEEKIVELKDTVTSLRNDLSAPEFEDTIVTAKKDMDTVVISLTECDSRRMLLGGIGIKGIPLKEKAEEFTPIKPAPVPRLFPNPAQAGALITIAYKEEDSMPDMVQIFTSGGQLVRQEIISVAKDASVFNLNLPSNLKPGMYLLKFSDSKNNTHHTEKLVIQ